ncbi:MAG: hypothetical protein WBO66_00525 [Candidatus Moraniibacteriota bacterium]
MSKYILPKIKKFDSFEELIKEKETYGLFEFRFGQSRPFTDLMGLEKSFILAEPGYGKTRCLKEVVKNSVEASREGLFLDIKKIGSESIEDFIKQKSAYADKLVDELDIQTTGFFVSQNFKLSNSNRLVICLDALDEVDQSIFSKVVENIREFSKKYAKISLYISCRVHFFRKYSDLFELDGFKYVHLAPLFQEEIEEFLIDRGVKKEDISTIFHTLDFKRDLIIQTPRYLGFLAEFISEGNIKEISRLKIADLFEFFIYRKLETENKKHNQYTIVQIDTIKRVLEKLALLMEIHQVSRIKEDDLMTFFDGIDSGLTLGFLQSAPSQLFFERGIIKDGFSKDSGNYFEFENTEFQEYLSAKEISRLGNINRTLYALSIDPELNEIYPSWFNTLRFVVNLNPSALDYILNLKNIGNSKIPIKEYHHFITKIDPNSLGNNARKAIFEEVFEYYRETAIYLDIDLIRNLAYFFDEAQMKILKEVIDANSKKDDLRSKINKINAIRLVSFIVERNILSSGNVAFWKGRLLKVALDKKCEKELRRVSLAALRSFDEKGVLNKIKVILSENVKDLTKEIISLYDALDPNGKDTIKVLVDGSKNGCYIESLGSLLRTDISKNFLYSFLDFLAKDKEFLSSLLEHEEIFNEDAERFIDGIEKTFDTKLWNQVLQILEMAFSEERYWNAEKSSFINGLVRVASKYDEDFLIKLVDQVEQSQGLQKNIFGLQQVFQNSLTIKNVKEFVDRLRKIEHGERVALWALLSAKENNKTVFSEGKKYFKKEYDENDEYVKKYKKQQAYSQLQEKRRLDKEIEISLKEIKDKKTQIYHFNALIEFLRLEESQKVKINDKQQKGLKEVCKFIFDKFDPKVANIKISKKDKSIRTHSWITPFGIALEVGKKLNAADIVDNKIRKRLISYAYEHHLEGIFCLIKDIKKSEIENLFNHYKKSKKADIWKYRARSIIEVIKKFQLEEYEGLVRGFVDDAVLDIYDRKFALTEADSIFSNQEFLEKVFKKYKNKSDEQAKLAEKANEILITKYQSPVAINWRIDELKKRYFSFVRSEGVHSSDMEHELDSKEFASPIFDIGKTKAGQYMKEIIGLAEQSLEIYKKGNEFHAYAVYLWDIIMAYIERQKIHRTYSPLNEFEKFIIGNLSRDGVNFLSGMFQNIKTEYANYIGKPTDFNECIRKYNTLRKGKFENITNPSELRDVVMEIISKDIVRWIVDEGALKVMETLTKRNEGEDLIQKMLLMQLEACALKRGFIESEILFRREEEFLDGDKTDYLISYGFIGPIVIEIKRTDNGNVTSKKYREKLMKYMRGTNAECCIFLVFKIKKEDNLNTKVVKAKEIYRKDFPYIKVIGIDCVGSEGLVQ